ncbi:MAG: RNA pseudouridine synthase, partial [Deltaproteobacteria bacterium]|nr:RNA pseudouridine synthase [Deltaproteobacteria bacterium]
SKAGEGLENDFRNHRVNRQYLAVVEGAIGDQRGRIDFPLEKGDFKFGIKVREAETGGKKALTIFEVIERYPHATLLRVTVQTGRTHQVRVHLSGIGHPLVGDKIYGAGRIPFKRQALHAQVLGFRHPRTGKKIRVESPIPGDIKKLIDWLRENV